VWVAARIGRRGRLRGRLTWPAATANVAVPDGPGPEGLAGRTPDGYDCCSALEGAEYATVKGLRRGIRVGAGRTGSSDGEAMT
jgi:hypothetical protein